VSNTTFDGYLFDWVRPDLSAPGGERHTDVYVIARSKAEAIDIMKRWLPKAVFSAEGPEILEFARAHGVRDGEPKVIERRA
jgi:hypothetical protein